MLLPSNISTSEKREEVAGSLSKYEEMEEIADIDVEVEEVDEHKIWSTCKKVPLSQFSKDLIEQFSKWLASAIGTRKHPKSILNFKSTIGNMIKYFDNDWHRILHKEHVRHFTDFIDKVLQAKTIKGFLNTLKYFLDFAQDMIISKDIDLYMPDCSNYF